MIRALLLCAILCVPGLASAQAMVKVKAGSANNYRAMWSAGDRLFRLGILQSTFDVNKRIEPRHILKVMQDHPQLFSDLPPIPAGAAIGPGYVFKP